jgi:hypothetical protein
MATNDPLDPRVAADSRPAGFSFVTVSGSGLLTGVDPARLIELACSPST